MITQTFGFDLDGIYQAAPYLHPKVGFDMEMQIHNKLATVRTKHLARINIEGAFDYCLNDIGRQIQRTAYSVAVVRRCATEGLSDFLHYRDGGPSAYFPAPVDRLFSYYVDDSHSNLYSAWNRLAILLSLFWPSDRHIYPAYIKELSEKSELACEPMTHLMHHYERSFVPNNEPRRLVIHSESRATKYYRGHLRNCSSRAELEIIQGERDFLPEALDAHYQVLLQSADLVSAILLEKAS